MKSKYFPTSLLLFLVSINSIQLVSGANILFLLPIASKSHVNVFEPLLRALGERGHNITNLSPIHSSGMPPNVRQVVALPLKDIFTTMQDPFEMRKLGKLGAMMNISMDYIVTACEAVLDHTEVQHIINYDQYDLVIVDILLNYCMLGMLPKLKAPYIYVSTLAAPSSTLEPLGNRLPPSFVPSPFLEFSHQMTFMERVINLLFNLLMDVTGNFIFLPIFERVFQEKLRTDVSTHEINKNVSLMLINSHFATNYPRPNLPDVIEVGGMHTRSANPLPKDLEDFLSGSGDDGFIFFSLGSIAQGSKMPEEYRKVFVNVFAKLKQRVIWKWETETMPDLPKNVKLRKWLPQQDILGHKNIRMFITHGGLLSIQETLYHGVPLIGIPLFADQDLNVKQAEKAGFARTLEILEISEKVLESKIKEILGNEAFAQSAKRLSTVWRDQPQTPLELAVFWSEYVIRHKGATHMRSAARDLNFFTYYSLDVVAFLITLSVAFLFLFKIVITSVCRKLCKGKSVKNIKREKKVN